MKLPLTALLCLATTATYAIPAKIGLKHTMRQPDGTSVQLTLLGDENKHLYFTDDGISVIAAEGAYFYASLNDEGCAVCSTMLAHNPIDRDYREMSLLRQIDQTAVYRAAIHNDAPRRRLADVRQSQTYYPTVGEGRGLVFLVEFADVRFSTPNPYDYFSRMLNEEGFSLYNGTGSCRDYFIDNSGGIYRPYFDVYGPVKLPEARAFYGGNDSYGHDNNPQMMALHAAEALDSEVDFSRYDLDGDGFVDNVFIFYAGEGEAAGGGADTVWPHSWGYDFAWGFDGVRLCGYACGPELISSWMPDGIGTFCHEYCHVLGLPDLYNTDDVGAMYTPLHWSVMDQGCYNNDSRTPAGMSAYERSVMGWMGDKMYVPECAGSYSLAPLEAGGDALLLPTGWDNEYFLLENRQQHSWDTYLPHHGMLVWHIDYSASAWRDNKPNNNEIHQRVDILEACGRTYATATGWRRYPFPGTGNVTSLGYGGTPSLEDWYGADIGYVVTGITERSGVVSFDLSGESGIAEPQTHCPWRVCGHHISGNGTVVTVSDISGRTVAAGTEIDLSSPGIYIVTSDGVTAKVAL